MILPSEDCAKETRDTFLTRLHDLPGSAVFSEMEKARIELAYDLAKYAHRGQMRKDGRRYFEHPRGVALRLIDEWDFYDAEMVMAGLLHDAYEDAEKYVTPLKIRIICGPAVERMVRLLSKMPKEGYLDRLLRFADWRTLTVKIPGDRWDNLCDMPMDDAPESAAFRLKYARETWNEYLPKLVPRLIEIAPEHLRPKFLEVGAAIRRRLAEIGYPTPESVAL